MKKCERACWITLAILILLLLMFQIYLLVGKYLAFEISTTTKHEGRTELPYPKFLVCPTGENLVNQGYLNQLQSDDLKLYIQSLATPSLIADSVQESVKGWSEEKWSGAKSEFEEYVKTAGNEEPTAYTNIGYQCSDLVKGCQTQDGKTIDCCRYAATVPTQYGLCVLVNTDLSGVNASMAGPAGMMSVTMKAPGGPAPTGNSPLVLPSGQQSRQTYWVFLLSSWSYTPSSVFALASDQLTLFVGISMIVEEKLVIGTGNHTHENFGGKRGKEKKETVEKHNELLTELSSKGPDCHGGCLVEQAQSHCNCTPLFAPNVWTSYYSGLDMGYCDGISSYKCMREQAAKPAVLECTAGCRASQGKSTKFDIRSVSVLPTASPSDEASFHLYYTDMEVEERESFYEYTMVRLISEIGLQVCIWLVFFLMIYAFVQAIKFCCNGCKSGKTDDYA